MNATAESTQSTILYIYTTIDFNNYISCLYNKYAIIHNIMYDIIC